MKCDCDCHKEKDKSDLKKCQESNKKKTRELNELRKKLLAATIQFITEFRLALLLWVFLL